MEFVGWPTEWFDAPDLDAAGRTGKTHVGDDAGRLIAHPAVDIIVECTGNPMAAVEHCLMSFRAHKHVINVTVEADAFCGPGLARKAAEAGVIYSMAYGDQPALTCDLVDWARTCGFTVVAAGRGHKWLPHYRKSTPETIWDHWGLTREQAERGRLNPKMFNAFLDGSKPAIESAAIANATGLSVPRDGLSFPPGSAEDIPALMRPKVIGGRLDHEGMVEVLSCLTTDGKPIPYDIRKGVWVCFRGDTDYIRNCFEEYKVITDESGRYMALYKKWHLIGLELGVSVASVGLRGEATGVATSFRGDVSAIAKRDLAPARCSTEKADTRSRAACGRLRSRSLSAIFRWASPTRSRSSGRLRTVRRSPTMTLRSTRRRLLSVSARKWKPPWRRLEAARRDRATGSSSFRRHVVALEQAIAAPLATRHLADWGARVIKVERPGTGDFCRDYDKVMDGMSSQFVWTNRSKESLTLDLKSARDMEVFQALVAKADVFVQNLAPDAAKRMGIDAKTLVDKHPRLIACDISGYGSDGPFRSRKAYDLLVQCEAGVLDINGTADHPAKVGLSIVDIATGMYVLNGVLTALYRRERTGAGLAFEISLFDSITEWMSYPAYFRQGAGRSLARTGMRHASIAPYGPSRSATVARFSLASRTSANGRASACRSSRSQTSSWTRASRPTRSALRMWKHSRPSLRRPSDPSPQRQSATRSRKPASPMPD